MKIAKRQLKRIIKESLLSEAFAATAQEEAEKINSQTGPNEFGMSLVTDQDFWEKRGIRTGEDLAKSILSQTYSDYYKEINGMRPRGRITPDMSVDDIQKLIDNLDQQAKDEWYEERHQLDQEGWEEDMVASVKTVPESIPEEYWEYETVPSRQGMSRRGAGSKSQRRMEGYMKLTKARLKRIIKEEKAKLKEYDSDGDPVYSASAEEELVDTVERIEKIIGEDGVQRVLSKMGYGN